LAPIRRHADGAKTAVPGALFAPLLTRELLRGSTVVRIRVPSCGAKMNAVPSLEEACEWKKVTRSQVSTTARRAIGIAT
jgi:hypothetical protein